MKDNIKEEIHEKIDEEKVNENMGLELKKFDVIMETLHERVPDDPKTHYIRRGRINNDTKNQR